MATGIFRLLLAGMAAPPSLFSPASPFPSRFPLALNTLKAAVRKTHGRSVETVLYDRQHETNSDELINLVCRGRFDLVGLSVPFGHEPEIRTILGRIGSEVSDSDRPRIVLGNALLTYSAERFLSDYPETYIVCGEGEYALCALIDRLKHGADLEGVPNLAYVSGGTTRIEPSLPVDPQDFVVPDTDGLREAVESGGIIQLEASRGCSWGRCTFCNRFRLCSGWRPFPIDTVINALDRFRGGGMSQVVFADEDFLGSNLERSLELAEAIIASGIHLRSWISVKVQDVWSRCDTGPQRQFREECLARLRRAGVETVFLGIESGATAQLKRYGKPITPAESAEAVRLLRAIGFEVVCGFIMFDPFLSLGEIEANLNFLEQTELEQKTFIFNRVNISEHNTQLKRKIERAGLDDGLDEDGIYHPWRFADPDVAALAGLAQAWMKPRQVYNALLAPQSDDRARGSCTGGEPANQHILRELQKTIRSFDLAFFKLLLLCFKEVNDPGSFLAGLGLLGFTSDERTRLLELAAAHRSSRSTGTESIQLDELPWLVLAKRRLYAEQKLQRLMCESPGTSEAARVLGAALADIMSREASAVLDGCYAQVSPAHSRDVVGSLP